MKRSITKILSTSKYSPLFMGIISIVALGIALTSQYVFGLDPCVLCIYQRWPYAIVIFLGLLASIAQIYSDGSLITELDEVEFGEKRDRQDKVRNAGFMSIIGLTFLSNSAIAAYHSGVERHWWKSFLEGCAVPKLEGDMEDIIKNLQMRDAARCDEIPWADPILGLSMANYNVIICFGLALAAFISAKLILQANKTH